MLPRKTTHADLEHKRSIFFEIGFVISLAIVLLMMELNFTSNNTKEFQEGSVLDQEQEMVPITRQEQKLPPPPPKIIKATDIINIVDNDVIIEEELEFFDSETNEDQVVELMQMPVLEQEEEEGDAPIFMVVEEMPIFRPDICKTTKEGNAELMRYISKAIRYPVIAAENGIMGRVYVTFVVSPAGEVTNVQVSRGVHPELDKEAIRVVQDMPAFSPGKQRGKPVRVQYSVPINFVLQ
ncbi:MULTISPECIES: energy transducer TonB [unclassified Saccharicrinis]|uniref:energy transducer TonB n=1 Tax=unclassified Saccharicrinis TaxID=2646859 RepID=UPI003D354F1D